MPGQRQGRWFLGTGGVPSQSQEGPRSALRNALPRARCQVPGPRQRSRSGTGEAVPKPAGPGRSLTSLLWAGGDWGKRGGCRAGWRSRCDGDHRSVGPGGAQGAENGTASGEGRNAVPARQLAPTGGTPEWPQGAHGGPGSHAGAAIRSEWGDLSKSGTVCGHRQHRHQGSKLRVKPRRRRGWLCGQSPKHSYARGMWVVQIGLGYTVKCTESKNKRR